MKIGHSRFHMVNFLVCPAGMVTFRELARVEVSLLRAILELVLFLTCLSVYVWLSKMCLWRNLLLRKLPDIKYFISNTDMTIETLILKGQGLTYITK